VVVQAAEFHGFKPLGIVSEKATQSKAADGSDVFTFTFPVEEGREYVGIALPFRGKAESVFAVNRSDRCNVDPEATTLSAATATAGGDE
jgi:hypothetical protein